MEINIRYFGFLAEVVQKEAERIQTKATTIGQLRVQLEEQYPSLLEHTFVMAQANEIKSEEELLLPEEVALFPPFSGG